MTRDTHSLLAKMRRVYRILPKGFRYWSARYLINPAVSRFRRWQISSPARHPPSSPDAPLVVAGLFRTASGIGEGARATFRQLAAEGHKPIAVCLSDHFGLVDMESPIPLSDMPLGGYGTLIVQLNSPELPDALHALKVRRGQNWYIIGFWAWELSIFPPGWDRNFDLVSAIWTPSNFVTNALAQHPKAPPITTMGHRVFVPENLSGNRTSFDLPEGVRIYLTMADAMSSLERKNPVAAIRWFKKTHQQKEDAILIVKTRHLANHPGAEAEILGAIGDAPNIRLLDQSLDDHDKWTLMASIDCLISLHRSEGFGLPIAEAIALGKEVVVTAYSGNMDFCTSDNATLVDYDLVPCADRFGRYNFEGAVWAEPRLANSQDLHC